MKTATCIVTGDDLPTDRMIRFAVSPDGVVVPDLTRKLPGAGMWVTANRDTLEKAIRRNRFAWAARENVTVPRDLMTQIDMGLFRLAMETISLAKRAGQIAMGEDQVEIASREKPPGVYVVAKDSSANAHDKAQRLAKGKTIIDVWTRSDLARAVGSDDIVHIMIEEGGLSSRLTGIYDLLKSLRA